MLPIAQPAGVILQRLKVRAAWVIRDLKVILTLHRNQPQLVLRRAIVDQRSEASIAVVRIVIHLRDRRREPIIATVAIQAAVVRKLLRMVAEVQLIVGLVEVARIDHQLCLAVAFKPTARYHVENTIRAVAHIRRVAAALHLDIVNILRIDLRRKIAPDVRIRNLHTVDLPIKLVPAAHVQHVVRDIRSRREVRNHRETIRAIRSRRLRDILAIHQRRRRHTVHIRRRHHAVHRHTLLHPSHLHLKVQHRRRIRCQRVHPLLRLEPRLRHHHTIISERHRRN